MADTKIINMEGGALGTAPVGTEKWWVQKADGTVDYHWNPADAKTYYSNAPTLVAPALGTPASGVLTNCTGTAAGLTAGAVTLNGAKATTAGSTNQDYTTAAAVPWETEAYDTDSWHDNATNNSRMTVPTGVTKVDVHGHLFLQALGSDEQTILAIYKNGSEVLSTFQTVPAVGRRVQIYGMGLECVATDYWEIYLQHATDTTITINAQSEFTIRAVDF